MQFHVAKIDYTAAARWVERWHYSHLMPRGKNINYGLFADGELYAVIVYGTGINPHQARFLKVDNVIEIKRMCRSEPPLDGYPLSKFISVTSRMVREEYPHQCIVAFADPEYGHEGTVYRASNFTYMGKTNAEWHVVDKDGVPRHRRVAYRHSRRYGISIAEARDVLGLTRVKTKEKHRWVRYVKTPKQRKADRLVGEEA